MTDRLTRRGVLGAAAGLVAVGTGTTATATRSTVDPGSAADPDTWPTFGLDAANTGYAPDRAAPVAGAVEAWEHEPTDEDYWISGSPVVADGTVYFGNLDGVYAVDASDGSREWAVDFGQTAVTPAVADGRVYVGVSETLYALDAADGTEQWSLSSEDERVFDTPPTVWSYTVYAGNHDGRLYAVATDGTERWTYDTGGLVQAAPAVADGTVYVASNSGLVAAVGAVDGPELWTFEADASVLSAPTVVDGTVYVGADDDTLRALDAETGEQQWAASVSDGIRTSPVVADDTVYAATTAGRVHAYDVSDGTEQWLTTVTSDDESSGAAGLSVSPVAVGDRLYVPTTGREVKALRTADGSVAWTYVLPNAPSTTMAVADGRLYAGTRNNTLHALEADPDATPVDIGTGRTAEPTSTEEAELTTRSATTTGPGDGTPTDTPPETSPTTSGTNASAPTSSAVPTAAAQESGSGDPDGRDLPVEPATLALGTVGVGGLGAGYLWVRRGGDGDSPETTNNQELTGTDAAERQEAGDEQTAVSDGRQESGQERQESGEEHGGAGEGRQGSGDERQNSGDERAETSDEQGAISDERRESGDEERGASERHAGDSDEQAETGEGRRESGDGSDGDDEGSDESSDNPWLDRLIEAETVDKPDRVSGGADEVPTSGGTDYLSDEGDRRQANADTGGSVDVTGHADSWIRADWDVPVVVPHESRAAVDYADIEQLDLVGSGERSDVYRVRAETDSGARTLALKKPRIEGGSDSALVANVQSEAETWAALDDHRNVVDVVDWGTEPEPWILMEYMDGGHLGQRAGTFQFDHAVWTAVSTVHAVRHAHRQGVVHLDLKPTNVLFRVVEDAWDVPKVADWGLSWRLLTHSGTVEGFSPDYAAPEQVDDSFGDPDDRTDIYQLGALCYTLFTGQAPFEGPPADVVQSVVEGRPTPPSEVADLPEVVDDIVMTAMAKDRSDRYESVLYLRDDLRALVDD